MLRSFLARARAVLQSLSRDQRLLRRLLADERRHKAELASPLPALRSADEERHVLAMGELVHAWRTDEQPVIVAVVVDLPMPTVRQPTPAEVFAADPLGAPLADVDRSSPFYASVLAGQADWMSKETVDRLESPTGTWTRGDVAALLARGER